MAIVESQPAIEVQVLVKGEPATEYKENDPKLMDKIPPNTVVKYIEAISGAPLSVKFTLADTYQHTTHALMMSVFVDGKLCDKPLLPMLQPKKDEVNYRESTGASHRDLKDYIQKYKFEFVGTVETETTDPKIDVDKELTKEWGKIECRMHRINREGYIFGDTALNPQKSDDHEDVAEKAVKGRAVSHRVIFDEIEKVPVQTWWKTAYPDGEENPLATFVFYYRSKRALRELRIISAEEYAKMLDQEEFMLEKIGDLVKSITITDGTASLYLS